MNSMLFVTVAGVLVIVGITLFGCKHMLIKSNIIEQPCKKMK